MRRLAYCKICGQPRRQDVTLALCDAHMLAYWRDKKAVARHSTRRREKINEAQVREIRQLRAEGVSLRNLAEQYGIQPNTVHLIARRKRWRWVA